MKLQIQKYFSQLDQQFETQAAALPCEVSPRFKRTLGQYVYDPKNQGRKFRFSQTLEHDPNLLKQVVIHEYIHYYLESRYQIFGHGREFRQMCCQLGIPPRATIAQELVPQTSRYRIYCQKCRKQLGTRHRMSLQFRERLRKSCCRDCGGTIIIVDQSINQQC
ncbi:MAG: SprT-like domain-containing protein [Culicoidibacterales bacterium]